MINRAKGDVAPSARWRLPAAIAATLFASLPAAAGAPAQKLLMSCHEMDAGSPSEYASFYEVRGNDLLRHGRSGLKTISTAGKLLFLSRTQDDRGAEDAFASHVRTGHVVVRTVYWRRPGQKMRKAFSERYDFRAKTVTASDGGGDTCHHDAWKGDEAG